MIGLDTNVVVRFLLDDHPSQSEAARQFFGSLSEGNPGYLSILVIAEAFWVLRSGARLPTSDVLDAIGGLVDSPEIQVESPARVRSALRLARGGADLPDALIAAAGRDAGCDEIVTFDRRAATSLGMRLLGEVG